MNKGDIILIPFPFTDLTGNKLRPEVVLIETNLDLTVSFITTQLKWREATDIELLPSKKSGIKKASLITVDKSLAVGKLGELQLVEVTELNLKQKQLLQLN
jgi:mRNA interferase MazF